MTVMSILAAARLNSRQITTYSGFLFLFFLAICLYSFLVVNNHHRRERGGVFAVSEFQPSANEANFRFVVNVFMEPFCICPGWKQHHHKISVFFVCSESLFNPVSNFAAVRRIYKNVMPPPTIAKGHLCFYQNTNRTCDYIRPRMDQGQNEIQNLISGKSPLVSPTRPFYLKT